MVLPPHSKIKISTNSFQHDCPDTIHNLLKLNTGLWANERKRPSSAANCSPPRPSNAGVALAELKKKQNEHYKRGMWLNCEKS